MKIFNIEVITKKPKKIWGLPAYDGRITIGDFWETLYMPVDSWSIEQYKNQWREGIGRLKTHDASCFVVTVQNLTIKPLIDFWPLYKVGDTIFIQNNLVTPEMAEEVHFPISLFHFNSGNCYDFVHPRTANSEGKGVTDEGERLSEWSATLSSLENLVIK